VEKLPNEILLLEAQICVLSDLMTKWEYESLEDVKTHMQWLWNDLEDLKTELLQNELKKEMTCLSQSKSNHTQFILA